MDKEHISRFSVRPCEETVWTYKSPMRLAGSAGQQLRREKNEELPLRPGEGSREVRRKVE